MKEKYTHNFNIFIILYLVMLKFLIGLNKYFLYLYKLFLNVCAIDENNPWVNSKYSSKQHVKIIRIETFMKLYINIDVFLF